MLSLLVFRLLIMIIIIIIISVWLCTAQVRRITLAGMTRSPAVHFYKALAQENIFEALQCDGQRLLILVVVFVVVVVVVVVVARHYNRPTQIQTDSLVIIVAIIITVTLFSLFCRTYVFKRRNHDYRLRSLSRLISRQPVRARSNFRSVSPPGIRYTWTIPACAFVHSEVTHSGNFF